MVKVGDKVRYQDGGEAVVVGVGHKTAGGAVSPKFFTVRTAGGSEAMHHVAMLGTLIQVVA